MPLAALLLGVGGLQMSLSLSASRAAALAEDVGSDAATPCSSKSWRCATGAVHCGARVSSADVSSVSMMTVCV